MPTFQSVSRGGLGAPGKHPGASRGGPRGMFRSPARSTASFVFTGTTQDGAGAALGGCTVLLFRAGSNAFVGATVSDEVGNYALSLPDNAGPFFLVSYKASSPDTFGTTINTLLPTQA